MIEANNCFSFLNKRLLDSSEMEWWLNKNIAQESFVGIYHFSRSVLIYYAVDIITIIFSSCFPPMVGLSNPYFFSSRDSSLFDNNSSICSSFSILSLLGCGRIQSYRECLGVSLVPLSTLSTRLPF